jgi:hypothetical protein
LKDGHSIIWTIGWDLITLETTCKKGGEMKENNVVSNPTFAMLRFYIPTSIHTYIAPIL